MPPSPAYGAPVYKAPAAVTPVSTEPKTYYNSSPSSNYKPFTPLTYKPTPSPTYQKPAPPASYPSLKQLTNHFARIPAAGYQTQPLYNVPAPEVPTPEVPAPEVPAPEVLTPEVPVPEVPVPEAPTPEVPAPETPILEAAAYPTLEQLTNHFSSIPAAGYQAQSVKNVPSEVPAPEAPAVESLAPKVSASAPEDDGDVDIGAIGGHTTTLLEKERNGSLKKIKGLSAIDQEDFSVDSVEESARKRRKLVLERLNALRARGNIKNANEYYSWS